MSNYSPHTAYTGLVVDCSGLGLERAMSPVVRSANGVAIYGTHITDYNLVTSKGAVGYSDDARYVARAGSRPLVVYAEALTNGGTYPVISAEDAAHVLAADRIGNFLSKMNVVFVR